MTRHTTPRRPGTALARTAPPRPRRQPWVRTGAPLDQRWALTLAGEIAARTLHLAGLLALGVLWVLRPLLVLASRLVVVLVWVALAVLLIAGATGQLPTATGSGSGSGWDALPPLVQVIAVAFPAGLLAVLVAGQFTHRRQTQPASYVVDAGLDDQDVPVTVTVVVHGWACPGCAAVSSAPLASLPEAVHLAGVHDRLWHGGSTTATPVTVAQPASAVR